MSSDASLYGECRFCLALGDHQDVMKEYLHGECREVYYDMFLECFNVFLITPRGANLICKGCVARLRDATSFRNMVINAEKDLQAACQRYQIESVADLPEIKYELISDVKVEEGPELVDVQSDGQELVDVQSDGRELVDVKSDDEALEDAKSDDVVFVCDTVMDIMDNDENRSPSPCSSTLKNTKDSVMLECDFCFKEFDSKRKLIRHITEHSVDNDRDKDNLKPDPSLKTNKRNQKDQRKNIYVCKYCDKEYKLAHALKKHVLEHVGSKPYVCKFCGRMFSRLRSLSRHKGQHTDAVLNYACDVCNKQFYDKFLLDRHKLVHTKEKPYLCETCGIGFTTKAYLVDHLNKHVGVKAHPCPVCKRKFTHMYQKTWHIKKCKAYEEKKYETPFSERKDYGLRKRSV